ncbi:MAG: magnesium transporter [Crocinitomix sp.]|nr:magnesium transporter [Crocinitomix sp.]
MKFELTKQYLEELKVQVELKESVSIQDFIDQLHPADIADILENLDESEAKFVYELLNEEKAADALMELDDDFRQSFLKLFSSQEIAEQVDQLDTDDAADLLGELEDSDKEQVISQMEDQEHASEVIDLLRYDEDSAGGLMQTEYIVAREKWNVKRCVIEMRKQAEEVEKVFSIYVIDDEDRLLGILSLRRLLFAEPNALIEEIYSSENIHYVKTNESKETVAEIMEKYDLVSVPVVDMQQKLVGRITIDDVVDVIREEAERDFQMASGISENVESSSSILKNTRSRLPWILIGLAGGVMSSQIIKGYESTLSIIPSLAFFIPLIASTAGNIGVQSSAIVVQGLASNDFQMKGILQRVGKESLVGMIVGMICALVILGFSFFFGGDDKLAITLACSLFVVVLFSAVLGTLIPLVLDRLKIDPALATGPFITTANDIIGLSIYFLVAYLVYF